MIKLLDKKSNDNSMLEHGVTFASSGDDAFNLNAPVAG